MIKKMLPVIFFFTMATYANAQSTLTNFDAIGVGGTTDILDYPFADGGALTDFDSYFDANATMSSEHVFKFDMTKAGTGDYSKIIFTYKQFSAADANKQFSSAALAEYASVSATKSITVRMARTTTITSDVPLNFALVNNAYGYPDGYHSIYTGILAAGSANTWQDVTFTFGSLGAGGSGINATAANTDRILIEVDPGNDDLSATGTYYIESISGPNLGVTTSVTKSNSNTAINSVAYPNPYISQVNYSFELEKSSNVSIQLINTEGKVIKSVFEGFLTTGNHDFLIENNSEKSFYINTVVDNKVTDSKLIIRSK